MAYIANSAHPARAQNAEGCRGAFGDAEHDAAAQSSRAVPHEPSYSAIERFDVSARRRNWSQLSVPQLADEMIRLGPTLKAPELNELAHRVLTDGYDFLERHGVRVQHTRIGEFPVIQILPLGMHPLNRLVRGFASKIRETNGLHPGSPERGLRFFVDPRRYATNTASLSAFDHQSFAVVNLLEILRDPEHVPQNLYHEVSHAIRIHQLLRRKASPYYGWARAQPGGELPRGEQIQRVDDTVSADIYAGFMQFSEMLNFAQDARAHFTQFVAQIHTEAQRNPEARWLSQMAAEPQNKLRNAITWGLLTSTRMRAMCDEVLGRLYSAGPDQVPDQALSFTRESELGGVVMAQVSAGGYRLHIPLVEAAGDEPTQRAQNVQHLIAQLRWTRDEALRHADYFELLRDDFYEGLGRHETLAQLERFTQLFRSLVRPYYVKTLEGQIPRDTVALNRLRIIQNLRADTFAGATNTKSAVRLALSVWHAPSRITLPRLGPQNVVHTEFLDVDTGRGILLDEQGNFLRFSEAKVAWGRWPLVNLADLRVDGFARDPKSTDAISAQDWRHHEEMMRVYLRYWVRRLELRGYAVADVHRLDQILRTLRAQAEGLGSQLRFDADSFKRLQQQVDDMMRSAAP